MKASQKTNKPDESPRFFHHPVQALEAFHWPPVEQNDLQNSELHCTAESSWGTGNYPGQNSSCGASSSSDGSPSSQPNSQSYMSEPHQALGNAYGSPVSGSCVTDYTNDCTSIIRELQSALLGDEPHELGMDLGGQNTVLSDMWNIRELILRGDLKAVLCACAKAMETNDASTTEWLITELRQMVSVCGEPIQRLGAYMLEGLVAKLESSGSKIYEALKCKEPTGPELLSYMHLLYEACPYFKFGYHSANGAIAEAMKNEKDVHIIDFQIVQGSQWMSLIQALSSRPGGPPRIRITGIDDATSAYARSGGPEIVGQRLARFAQSCSVPLEFHAVTVPGSQVQVKHLGVRPGEAIAVNFPLMLHHIPDQNVSFQNHRDRLLRLTKHLCPKVVTLVEQEANTNTTPFYPRFVEAMNHYLLIFESIDVKLPRDHKERISVEQHCLAREIVNIIACEGVERVERHEPLDTWRSRFVQAGFSPCPLNSIINGVIKSLLANYSEHYTLEEKDGALYLGWRNQALVTSCAWR